MAGKITLKHLAAAVLLTIGISFSLSSSIRPALSTKTENSKFPVSPVSVIYYSQTDPRWAGYLYGGTDPMKTYGCGPTILAMAVSSLTETKLTPPMAAKWSADHGCWSKGNGSFHRLIPEGAHAYGLTAESMSIHTPEAVRTAIESGKFLVFLMGPGDFTKSGHFILAYKVNSDGTVNIADPASRERSSRRWPVKTLLKQLSSVSNSGGPLWALSKSP